MSITNFNEFKCAGCRQTNSIRKLLSLRDELKSMCQVFIQTKRINVRPLIYHIMQLFSVLFAALMRVRCVTLFEFFYSRNCLTSQWVNLLLKTGSRVSDWTGPPIDMARLHIHTFCKFIQMWERQIIAQQHVLKLKNWNSHKQINTCEWNLSLRNQAKAQFRVI